MSQTTTHQAAPVMDVPYIPVDYELYGAELREQDRYHAQLIQSLLQRTACINLARLNHHHCRRQLSTYEQAVLERVVTGVSQVVAEFTRNHPTMRFHHKTHRDSDAMAAFTMGFLGRAYELDRGTVERCSARTASAADRTALEAVVNALGRDRIAEDRTLRLEAVNLPVYQHAAAGGAACDYRALLAAMDRRNRRVEELQGLLRRNRHHRESALNLAAMLRELVDERANDLRSLQWAKGKVDRAVEECEGAERRVALLRFNQHRRRLALGR